MDSISGWSALGRPTVSASVSRLPASPSGTLVDLLDRVLDGGLVINADIVITLAGIPLVGVTLRAAVAGMETMVRYGLLTEWDASIRAQKTTVTDAPVPAIAPDTLPSETVSEVCQTGAGYAQSHWH